MEKLLAYLNAERGRRIALAKALGCSPSAISMWKRVPGERLGEVSRATGIAPQELRPDLVEDAA
jgi:DNA-binding transcriptional regulator YdaS (Cro superfamily)